MAFASRNGVNPRSGYLPICRTMGPPHQLTDIGVGGGPPSVARVIHLGADELLIQKHSVGDGEFLFSRGPSMPIL
jgi:hypothetical protein